MVWGLAALLALGAAAGPARGAEDAGPLPWRVGGPAGFAVNAASFPDSAGHWLEVYVRVPPATLAALKRDSIGGGRLRLTARLRPRSGESHDAVEEFALTGADTASGQGKVLMLRFPARPGVQRLQVRLDDMLSRKKGLVYAGRVVNRSAAVEGELVVPAPQAGRELSDLEFVWSGAADAPSAFERDGMSLIPDPDRLYGLYANELRAWFVARGLPGDSRPWRWSSRVFGPGGQVVAQRESTAAASEWLRALVGFDLSTEPAGAYELEVKAWQEGDAGALLRRARFSVAWQRESWMRNPRDVEDNVHFLLPPDIEDTFATMSPGEQERYLEEFWRVRDPSPETAANEARDTYLSRVDFANRTYTRYGLEKGMFSDMGRVFIRYGEPTEVLHQVLPAGDETLLQAIRELSLSEERALGDVHQKGLGGDMRPYEIWIYDGDISAPIDVDPHLPRNLSRRSRLVFLFVDEQGLGNYTLRYSTE